MVLQLAGLRVMHYYALQLIYNRLVVAALVSRNLIGLRRFVTAASEIAHERLLATVAAALVSRNLIGLRRFVTTASEIAREQLLATVDALVYRKICQVISGARVGAPRMWAAQRAIWLYVLPRLCRL